MSCKADDGVLPGRTATEENAADRHFSALNYVANFGRRALAHHRISWADGGPTDLTNLILLCRFHHTCVHEGRIMITRNPAAPHRSTGLPGGPPWQFTLPSGQPVDQPAWSTPSADWLIQRLTRPHPVDHIDRLNHPEARPIQPKQYGERFDLHAAVGVLFDLSSPSRAAA
ncbi:HNH endonuclease signature motif containing protein [Microlunatus speluncae]|uniref:HNH endonuclease signature motif containing protein n=1 Tax=Microlunatus speluncae TaxID=2594267 RepID=UPI001FE2C6D0|nr:HNH endonuclease signature motif containing protein [Microlunatus speluncae]